MLSAMRSSGSNVFVWIIILLLIVGLAGFGISQSGGAGSELAVATVGDEEVTANEFGQAYQTEMNRLSQQFGRQLTQQEMQIFGGDQIVLTQLLTLAALDGEAKGAELSVGDEAVRELLVRNPAFQGLDGAFSAESYEFILQRSNIEAGDYEQSLREDATRQLLAAAVSGGVDIGTAMPSAIVKFVAERRGVSFVKLEPQHLTSPVSAPTSADLDAYYSANKDGYTRPETRDVTYGILRETDLIEKIDVSDADIAAEFEARRVEYQQPAMVSLDRIVFGNETDATEALAQINSDETDFDAVAEARGLSPSDIELGEMTSGALSTAARAPIFAATEPGVLGPFQSDLGPALYRINAIIPANEQSLEDVRDDLRLSIAQDVARDRLANATDEIDDLIVGGATLEDIGNESDMTLEQMLFDPSAIEGIAADSRFREEVLDAEIGESRDLIDLSDGSLLVVRVNEINPPRIPPLSEITEDVTNDWTADKTREALKFRAEDLEKRLKAGETLADIAQALSLTLASPEPVARNEQVEGAPQALTEQLFAGTNGDPVIVEADSAAYLAVIGDLVPANLTDDANRQALDQIKATMQNSVSQDVLNYFATGLQEREGVSVNQGLLQSVLGQIFGGGHGGY